MGLRFCAEGNYLQNVFCVSLVIRTSCDKHHRNVAPQKCRKLVRAFDWFVLSRTQPESGALFACRGVNTFVRRCSSWFLLKLKTEKVGTCRAKGLPVEMNNWLESSI